MKFFLDSLEILWPYDFIYPEQYNYMIHLLSALRSSNANANRSHALLEMPTGCWGLNTKLMLADGRSELVQNIRPGDQLMGDDGTARTVKPNSLVRNRAEMFEITSSNKDRPVWNCNDQHILVLKWNHQPSKVRYIANSNRFGFRVVVGEFDSAGRPWIHFKTHSFDSRVEAIRQQKIASDSWTPLIAELTVLEFLDLDKSIQSAAQMFQPDRVQFQPPASCRSLHQRLSSIIGHSVSDSELLEIAYNFGIWLADGSKLIDREFNELLRDYDLLAQKRFPCELLSESDPIRQAILEGAIDGADDHQSNQIDFHYELTANQRELIDGFVHLARSLGFTASSIQPTNQVNETGKESKGFRVQFGGPELERLQMRLPQKRIPASRITQSSQVQRCDGFTVRSLGVGDYYGFQLDGNGRCLLDDFLVTHNTGKTVSLLSLTLAFQYANPDTCGKIVYCTRTVQEMDKVVAELKRIMAFRESVIKQRHEELLKSQANLDSVDPAVSLRSPAILGVCLSSRRNLCIHPEVARFDNRSKVDAMCRNLTASFVREERKSDDIESGCRFFEKFDRVGRNLAHSMSGVYSLADLKEFGNREGYCPYFLARHLISIANVVVYNYQYLLDPKISNLVSKDLPANSIIICDESHNIDNVCIEALSVTLDQRTISVSSGNISTLQTRVNQMERDDNQRLQAEYDNLVRGLNQNRPAADATDSLVAHPIPALSSASLDESCPGSIRRAKHFLMFLRSICEFLKVRLSSGQVSEESPTVFLSDLQRQTNIGQLKALKVSFDRLSSLFKTLKLTDLDQYSPLVTLTHFATLVSTYSDGFVVLFEPFDDRTPAIPDPKLQLCCLDSSLAIAPLFQRYRSVIITSGTLSPLSVYPRILNFRPAVTASFPMSLTRNVIQPLIVTRGSDQVPICSKFDLRGDIGVIQNYGRLLVDLAQVIPDGIVAFFTSYSFMEEIVSKWKEQKILDELLKHKLLFIETKDVVETTLALDAFKRACECGRGAIFFSVARGKVAEGIDFDRHFGRCVVMFGIPYQFTLSRVLRARLNYLRENFQLSEAEFLTFDAIRQTSQCVGRVIRSKLDYGIMIFADQRYAKADKREKLPGWIKQFLDKSNLNLSTDQAINEARHFLKRMAQPRKPEEEIGVTMMDQKLIESLQAKQKAESESRNQQMDLNK